MFLTDASSLFVLGSIGLMLLTSLVIRALFRRGKALEDA